MVALRAMPAFSRQRRGHLRYAHMQSRRVTASRPSASSFRRPGLRPLMHLSGPSFRMYRTDTQGSLRSGRGTAAPVPWQRTRCEGKQLWPPLRPPHPVPYHFQRGLPPLDSETCPCRIPSCLRSRRRTAAPFPRQRTRFEGEQIRPPLRRPQSVPSHFQRHLPLLDYGTCRRRILSYLRSRRRVVAPFPRQRTRCESKQLWPPLRRLQSVPSHFQRRSPPLHSGTCRRRSLSSPRSRRRTATPSLGSEPVAKVNTSGHLGALRNQCPPTFSEVCHRCI